MEEEKCLFALRNSLNWFAEPPEGLGFAIQFDFLAN